MKRAGYLIALPFIYFISLAPFWLLYLISDFFFVLVFYVMRYRRKVVEGNLRRSFPEKSNEEVLSLSRDFYRYFCDLLLETFKTLTISAENMAKHCCFEADSVKLINQLYADKKSIIIVLGHLGNWEWAGNAFSMQCKHQLYVIYHPLTHSGFNQLMIDMRTRFGTKLIAMKDTFREMTNHKDELTATGFIADQTPPPETAHWTNFMHQDTPVFKGTERMAARFKYPTLYINVNRVKRGYYEIKVEDVVLNPEQLPEGQLTEWHTHLLERAIRTNPATWLWSHKRWKHSRK